MLLLNLPEVTIEQIQKAHKWNTTTAQGDFGGAADVCQKEMPISVGVDTVNVNMEVLWAAAAELSRSKRVSGNTCFVPMLLLTEPMQYTMSAEVAWFRSTYHVYVTVGL